MRNENSYFKNNLKEQNWYIYKTRIIITVNKTLPFLIVKKNVEW